MLDWRRLSVPKLIQEIAKEMRFERLLIMNALCQRTNELELTPKVLHYAIPQEKWNKWSSLIRDRALHDFLLGRPPFLSVYEVSESGTTYQRKAFGKLAAKPGSYQKFRNASKKIIIHRSKAVEPNVYIALI